MDGSAPPSAGEVWNRMVESRMVGQPFRVTDAGADSAVTYGGELEGSSSRITRVAGPSRKLLEAYVFEHLGQPQREQLLRALLGGWSSGRYRSKDIPELRSSHSKAALRAAGPSELAGLFRAWLDRVGDYAFEYLSPSARIALYNGAFAGQTTENSLKRYSIQIGSKAPVEWIPFRGEPEKLIESIWAEPPLKFSGAWEIHFRPQASYSEFEEGLDWMARALAVGDAQAKPIQHLWMALAKKDLPPSEAAAFRGKLGELYKNVQALAVITGVEHDARDLLSHADLTEDAGPRTHTDDRFGSGHATSRGAIRLEDNRFQAEGQEAYNLEIRRGAFDDQFRQFVELAISSRYATGDFRGLRSIEDWRLIPGDVDDARRVARELSMPLAETARCLDRLRNVQAQIGARKMKVSPTSLIPFWNWKDAPYLSQTKKALLMGMSRALVRQVAGMKDPRPDELLALIRSWVLASRLSGDIQAYLRPQPPGGTAAPPVAGKAPKLRFAYEFHPPIGDSRVPDRLGYGMDEKRLEAWNGGLRTELQRELAWSSRVEGGSTVVIESPSGRPTQEQLGKLDEIVGKHGLDRRAPSNRLTITVDPEEWRDDPRAKRRFDRLSSAFGPVLSSLSTGQAEAGLQSALLDQLSRVSKGRKKLDWLDSLELRSARPNEALASVDSAFRGIGLDPKAYRHYFILRWSDGRSWGNRRASPVEVDIASLKPLSDADRASELERLPFKEALRFAYEMESRRNTNPSIAAAVDGWLGSMATDPDRFDEIAEELKPGIAKPEGIHGRAYRLWIHRQIRERIGVGAFAKMAGPASLHQIGLDPGSLHEGFWEELVQAMPDDKFLDFLDAFTARFGRFPPREFRGALPKALLARSPQVLRTRPGIANWARECIAHTEDARRRRDWAEVLARVRRDDLAEDVAALLAHRNAAVRRVGAALAKRAPTRRMAEAIAPHSDDPDPVVRRLLGEFSVEDAAAGSCLSGVLQGLEAL